MWKRILFLVLLYRSLGAQDTVYFLDGEKRDGKVIEIGPDMVLVETDGEKKQIARQYIMLIQYKNGFFETFNRPAESKTIVRNSDGQGGKSADRKVTKAQINNRVSFNSLALANSDIAFFYEYLIPNSKVGLSAMGAYNFNSGTGFYNAFIDRATKAKKNYDLGVSVDFYSSNPREKTSFFGGLMIKYTNFSYYRVVYMPSGNGTIRVVNEGRASAYNLATLFTFGISRQWPDNFFIKSIVGAGGCFLRGDIRNQLGNANSTQSTDGPFFLFKGYLSLNIGYCF